MEVYPDGVWFQWSFNTLLCSEQISASRTALNRQEFLGGFYEESETFCVYAFRNISRTPKCITACDIASHISLT